MKFTTLDTVVKGILLQKGYPIHFYVEFLTQSQRCFEEIHFDTIGNVNTVRLPINGFAEARLPDDFMDWVKIAFENGQFLKPLVHRPGINRLPYYDYNGIISGFGPIIPGSAYTDGTYTSIALQGGFGAGALATIIIAGGLVTSCTITTPGINYAVGDVLSVLNTDVGGTGTGFSINVLTISSASQSEYPNWVEYFDSLCFFGYDLHYNNRLEFTGRYYGAQVNRIDSFEVVPELNMIQFHQEVPCNYIILQYISDGSSIDNATQITPYAKKTIEAYCNWQHKENGRTYGEGERDRARRLFEFEHRKLRGRQNPMTMADFKNIIYRNSSGAPK